MEHSIARSRRWTYIWLTVAVAVILLTIGLISLLYQKNVPAMIWASVWFSTAIMAMSLVVVVIAWQRTRWLREKIAATEGLICPRCMLVMEGLETHDGEVDNESDLACRKCHMQWSRAEVRNYWTLLATEPLSAQRWLAEHRAKENNLPPIASCILRVRNSVPGLLAMNFALWLVMGLLIATLRGVSLFGGLFTYVHMACVMGGFMTLIAGWKRRKGDEERCASCGYLREPASESAVCAECGADWNAFGGIVRGQIERRPPVMALGIILILIGAVVAIAPFMARGWHLELYPTASLIREITQTNSFTMDEWATLRTRTLSPQQELRLAEGLLNKRLRKSFFSGDADNWLVGQIAASKLPQELVDRYYAEEIDFWILAPERMTVGEQATIAMASRYRLASTNNPKPTVLFRGYFLDGEPEPHASLDRGVPGIMFGEKRFHIGEQDAGQGTSPKLTCEAGTPGGIRIRAELWVVSLPPGVTVQNIAWQPDGTPVLPAGVVWSQQRTIEHTIEVGP